MPFVSLPPGFGPTTGACAAAATAAALKVWEGEPAPSGVAIDLPGGGEVSIQVEAVGRLGDSVWAKVKKPHNSDVDVTVGLDILVQLRRRERPGVGFIAGPGVGVVTRKGLALPPGEAAINPGPRRMIEAVLSGFHDQSVGWEVEISVPGGIEAAEKTYNPRLGIKGGISILGNSGLVRPYCRQAQKDAFACSLAVAAAAGFDAMLLVPGHIGMAAASGFVFAPEQALEVGNAWDLALPLLGGYGMKRLLLVGHPGKLGKLLGGIVNTHSSASASAVPHLAALATEFGMKELPEIDTAEGWFKAIAGDKAKVIADLAAARLVDLIHRDFKLETAVQLCDMAGQELGKAGDFSPWL